MSQKPSGTSDPQFAGFRMKPASNSRGENANGNRGDAIKIGSLEEGEPAHCAGLEEQRSRFLAPHLGRYQDYDGNGGSDTRSSMPLSWQNGSPQYCEPGDDRIGKSHEHGKHGGKRWAENRKLGTQARVPVPQRSVRIKAAGRIPGLLSWVLALTYLGQVGYS